jgi:hypothetical protein
MQHSTGNSRRWPTNGNNNYSAWDSFSCKIPTCFLGSARSIDLGSELRSTSTDTWKSLWLSKSGRAYILSTGNKLATKFQQLYQHFSRRRGQHKHDRYLRTSAGAQKSHKTGSTNNLALDELISEISGAAQILGWAKSLEFSSNVHAVQC